MHHNSPRSAGTQPLPVQLIAGRVFIEVYVHAGQPLLLDAQHHHHPGLLQGAIEVALDGDARAQFPGYVRQQRGRSTEDDAGTQAGQQERIRARHAGMEDVANDGHGDALKKSVGWRILGPP